MYSPVQDQSNWRGVANIIVGDIIQVFGTLTSSNKRIYTVPTGRNLYVTSAGLFGGLTSNQSVSIRAYNAGGTAIFMFHEIQYSSIGEPVLRPTIYVTPIVVEGGQYIQGDLGGGATGTEYAVSGYLL